MVKIRREDMLSDLKSTASACINDSLVSCPASVLNAFPYNVAFKLMSSVQNNWTVEASPLKYVVSYEKSAL
jgi:hypothetical protein